MVYGLPFQLNDREYESLVNCFLRNASSIIEYQNILSRETFELGWGDIIEILFSLLAREIERHFRAIPFGIHQLRPEIYEYMEVQLFSVQYKEDNQSKKPRCQTGLPGKAHTIPWGGQPT